jgi:hypothetical protein
VVAIPRPDLDLVVVQHGVTATMGDSHHRNRDTAVVRLVDDGSTIAHKAADGPPHLAVYDRQPDAVLLDEIRDKIVATARVIRNRD